MHTFLRRYLLVSTTSLLLGLSLGLATLPLTCVAGPTVTVRDVTIPAGRPFPIPLDGSGSGSGPLNFSVVSRSNTNLITQLVATNNPSLRLAVSGVDAGGTNFTGDLVLELFQDMVPHTTARIIDLVNSNFYNTTAATNMTFHRVLPNFMAQGGDPKGDGTGGSGVKFDDEFTWLLSFDGFGQLAMANQGPDTNDSQFFITDGDQPFDDATRQSLDFSYTIFGQMTSGFDILDKIMGTPLEYQGSPPELSRPITPVTIHSATIFTNEQAAVLLLYAPSSFTGTVSVTVRALDTSKVSTETTFKVTVVKNQVQDKPFLGPVPNLVTAENMPASFPFTYTDLSGVLYARGVVDAANWDLTNRTVVPPPNVSVNITNGFVTCTPVSNFTGTAQMVMVLEGVLNQSKLTIDTQHFTLTVHPRTLTIVPTKGTLQDTTKTRGDKVAISGTLVSTGPSFNPTNDALQVTLGDPVSPFQVTVPAGDPGWSGRSGKYAWKSPKTSAAKIALQFDTVKGTFAITASSFDFPGLQSGLVHFDLLSGSDYGTTERFWAPVGKKGGSFVLPRTP